MRETLDNATTGTTGNIGAVSLYPNSNCDTVVLNGQIWVMFRGNESRMIAKYAPTVVGSQWNVSFEAYAPRELTSYTGMGQQPGTYSIKALLNDSDGVQVGGIELRVDKAGVQGIYCYDPVNSSWAKVTETIQPAIVQRNGDSGEVPDRYVLSFSYFGGSTILASAYHIGGGQGFSKTIVLPNASIPLPVIHFFDEVSIGKLGATDYGINGGWMLDNFGVRSPGARYVIIEPDYEYVPKNSPVWLVLRDETGDMIDNASVWLDGHVAIFNVTTGRYEASYVRMVNWAVPVLYKVQSDGIDIEGRIEVTTMEADPAISIAKWWNGWDWASVFGLDDCSGPSSALTHYDGYNHPTTAYVMNIAGSSSDVLATQSEIALHMPHDYMYWMKKNWTESVSSAMTAQTSFKGYYAYSSRWDNPAYVGAGDTFISMANPGNSATYQMMYAQYNQGLRIEGIGSNFNNGVPGNASVQGCYWITGTAPNPYVAWDPTSPYDLLDAARIWSTDNAGQTYERVKIIADNGGLLRVYAHPGYSIQDSNIMHWIDNDKTNYSYENWKATDGEATSYIYGSWTTDVVKNEGQSDANALVYDVSRQNPKSAGYWLVPITLAIDVTGLDVKKIEVVEGGHTYSSKGVGGNALPDLNGKRIMDVGYDVRGNMLYVSHFWNSSSQLRIVLNESDPIITNQPTTNIVIDDTYYYNATATPASNGSNAWTLDNSSAPWVRMVQTNQTSCRLSGTSGTPGIYPLVLSVHDADSVSSIGWNITVQPRVAPQFTTAPLIMAVEDHNYSYQAHCDQTIGNWTMSTNATWLQLSSSGLLYGTPNNFNAEKDYNVNLTASNGNGTVYQTFQVHVVNVPPQFITVALGNVMIGQPYNYQPATSDDGQGAVWTGLTTDLTFPYNFNNSTGQLSFLAASAGSFHFDLTVSDGSGATNQTAIQSWVVNVTLTPLPQIIGPPSLNAVEDAAYYCSFSSDQTIDQWQLVSNASWLDIWPNGTVHGTPTNPDAGKNFSVTVNASNANGTGVLTYTLQVINLPPQFQTNPPLNGKVGVLYKYEPHFDDQSSGGYHNIASNLTFPYQYDPLTGIVEFTPMSPGTFWIALTADDGSGTINATATQNWTVTITASTGQDTTPPVTDRTINGTLNGGWYQTPVSVGLSAWDDLSGVNQTQYRLDGGSWKIYSIPIAVNGDGDHTLEYRSIDLAGNIESIRSTIFKIDAEAPSTSIGELNGTNGANGWYISNVSVLLNSTDDRSGVSSISYRIDGGPWTTYSSVILFSNEGVHTLDYRATDVAGNGEAVRSMVVKVDQSRPVTTLTVTVVKSVPDRYNGSVIVNMSAVDITSSLDRTFFRVDGGDWIVYYGNMTMAMEGLHTIDYYSLDRAGNNEVVKSRSLTIDTVTPITMAQVSGTMGLNDWYVSGVTVHLTASDNTSGIMSTTYRLDGGAWTDLDGTIELMTDGDHTIDYRSMDNASNLEQEHHLSFKIDTTAPSIAVEMTNGTVLTSSSVTIHWSSIDGASGVDHYAISVDGGPFIACAGPDEELNGLSVGDHNVVIKTIDGAGNEATTDISFKVDTSPFSPYNPNGPGILIGMIIGIAIAATILVMLVMRRKK